MTSSNAEMMKDYSALNARLFNYELSAEGVGKACEFAFTKNDVNEKIDESTKKFNVKDKLTSFPDSATIALPKLDLKATRAKVVIYSIYFIAVHV